MPKYSALVATDKITSNGDVFSKEALLQFAEQAKDLPVVFDFNEGQVIGKVEKASITEEGVEIEITLDNYPHIYVVPGGIAEEYHQEGKVQVIDKWKTIEFSITTLPADKTLKPIKEIKE
jgi:hypothetical protein